MAVGTSGPTRGTAPVFGREEAIGEILRVLDGAREGVGQGLLLIGPSGIGKSHLLRAASDRGRERDYRILTGRALPVDLPTPLALIREMLTSERSDPVHAPASPSEVPPAGDLPMYLAPFLSGDSSRPYASLAEPGREVRSSTEIDEILFPTDIGAGEAVGLGRQELIGRAADYFRSEAQHRPLLLLIDDLHFADSSSLDVLRRLASELAGAPIAVIASLAEDPFVPDRARPAIADLRRASAFRTILLRPFGPLEVAEFVRWIRGGRPATEAEVLRWHAQTDGNPLFVEQIVRSMTGYGTGAPGGDEPVGRDVTEMLQARYASMGAPERRLLAHAAVLGKEFSFADLVAVAGTTEERATEDLDRLVHGGLLRGRGGEVYEFVNEAMRAAVYSELTETRSPHPPPKGRPRPRAPGRRERFGARPTVLPRPGRREGGRVQREGRPGRDPCLRARYGGLASRAGAGGRAPTPGREPKVAGAPPHRARPAPR